MLLPSAPLHALLFLGALGSFIAPLLLGLLLPIVLVLPLLLLSMLLLLSTLLWLSVLLWLSMLLLGMVLLCALLLVLCVSRSSDSEKQRENGCAGDFQLLS